MNAHDILNFYKTFQGISHIVSSNEKRFFISGGQGSVFAVLTAAGFKSGGKTTLVVLPDEEEALQYQSDMRNLLPEQTVLFFPSSLKKDYGKFIQDDTNKVLRVEVLNQLAKNKQVIIIATAEGIVEKVVAQSDFEKNTFKITKNQILDIDQLLNFLEEKHFVRTDFVYEPGEFAIRGGIIDIFSYNSELPFRINMDDDTVNGLRIFDIDTQISKAEIENISITPDYNNEENNTLVSLFVLCAVVF